MAITFVGSGTDQGTGGTAFSGSAAPVAKLPTLQANDVIIACLSFYNGTAETITFTGYTSQIDVTGSAADRVVIYTKLATGSETTAAPTFSTSSWGTLIVYVLRGCSSATPAHVAHTTGSLTTTGSAMANPSLTIGGASDGTVYGYSGVLSGNTGAVTITLSGSLSNSATEAQSSYGGAQNIGWGTDVSSPGSTTAAFSGTLSCIDWALDFAPSAGSANGLILTGRSTAPSLQVATAGASLPLPLSPPSQLRPLRITMASAGLATATGTAQPPSVRSQSATDFILNAGESIPNSSVDQVGGSLATPLSPPSRLITRPPIVTTTAGLAAATGTAFGPSVFTQSATVLILTPEAPSSPDSVLRPAGASLPVPLTAVPLLVTRPPIVTAAAGLAHAIGTAQSPQAAIGAQPSLAHATGTALQPTVFTQSATSFILIAGAPVPGSLALAAGASLATPLAAPARRIAVPPVGAANAGLAHATGTAQSPLAGIGAEASLAHATGTAQQPQAQVFQPVGYVLGSGQPPVPDLAAVQAGSSLAPALSPRSRIVTAQQIVTPAAGLAHAAGVAQQPIAAIGAQPAVAHATGTAQQQSVAALSPVTLVLTAGHTTPGMAPAQAGASLAPALSPPSRRVTAPQPLIVTAGLAAATGTAQQPRAAIGAEASLAHATGISQPPSVFAQSVTDFILTAGEYSPDSIISGVGASLPLPLSPPGHRIAVPPPAASPNAGLAHAAGTAQSPRAAIGAEPSVAQGTGTAQSPLAGTGAKPSLAHATGTAYGPAPGRTPRLATATGAALTAQLAAAAHAQAAAALGVALTAGAQGNVPNVKGSSLAAVTEGAGMQAVSGEGAGMSANTAPGASSQGGVT